MSLSELTKKIKDQLNRFKNEFSKIRTKGSFAQNVSIVFSGNVINFCLRLIFTPIISRIYGPEAYGQYAYYNLIISNIGFIAAMALPTVYVLPKTRIEFLSLSKFVLISTAFTTVLSFLLFAISRSLWTEIDIDYISIPILVILLLMNSLNGVFGAWNVREKNFKRNSSVGVLSNLFSRLGTAGLGYYLLPTGLGLIVGDFIKSVIHFVANSSRKRKCVFFRFIKKRNRHYLLKYLRLNINVPKFIFPSRLITKFSSDLPVLAIGFFYDTDILGLYVFASSILSIPMSLFENSISPVIYQKANQVFQENENALGSFFLRSFRSTIIISIGPTFLLAILSPTIFPFFFGEEWHKAGDLAMLLSARFLMIAILSPYTGFWRIMKREKRLFFLNLLTTVFRVGPLLLLYLDLQFELFVYLYSIIGTIATLINLSDLSFSLLDKRKAFQIFYLVLIIILTYFVTICFIALGLDIL